MAPDSDRGGSGADHLEDPALTLPDNSDPAAAAASDSDQLSRSGIAGNCLAAERFLFSRLTAGSRQRGRLANQRNLPAHHVGSTLDCRNDRHCIEIRTRPWCKHRSQELHALVGAAGFRIFADGEHCARIPAGDYRDWLAGKFCRIRRAVAEYACGKIGLGTAVCGCRDLRRGHISRLCYDADFTDRRRTNLAGRAGLDSVLCQWSSLSGIRRIRAHLRLRADVLRLMFVYRFALSGDHRPLPAGRHGPIRPRVDALTPFSSYFGLFFLQFVKQFDGTTHMRNHD